MANELQVTISADTSGLEAGLDRATAAVQSSAQTMKDAQTAASIAAQNYSDTLAALNAVASGTGPGQAAAAAEIAATKTAAEEAAAAVEKLNIAKLRSSDSWNREMAAANKAAEGEMEAARAMEMAALRADILSRAEADATAEAERLAAAQQELAAATNTVGISSRQAATAGIGILEGRMMSGNRAAAAFLSTTLGLGPVLRAAFPVIGALAMIEVVGEIAKKIVEVSQDAQDLAGELGVGWLDGAVAELTGMKEVVKQTDQELLALAADRDRMRGQSLQLDVSTTSRHGGESAANEVEIKQLNDKLIALQAIEKIHGSEVVEYTKESEIRTNQFGSEVTDNAGGIAGALKAKENLKVAQAQYNDTLARERSLREQIADITSRQYTSLTESQINATHASDAGLKSAQHITAELEKQLQLNQTRFQTQLIENPQAADVATQNKNVADQQARAHASVELDQLRRTLTEQIAKSEIDVAHAMDGELNPAERISAELQKQLELHNLEAQSSRSGLPALDQKLRQLKDTAAAEKAVADIQILGDEQLGKTFDEEMKAEDEGRKQAEEAVKKSAEDYKRSQEEKVALAKEAANATIQAAEETFQYTQRQIQFEAELGIITAKTAQARLLAASQLKQTQTTGALEKEQATGTVDPAVAEKAAQETILAATETFEVTQKEIESERELGVITAKTADDRLAAAERLKQIETTGALEKSQGLFDPNLGQKELQEYEQLENRMNQVASKGALERERITQKETLKIIQDYQKLANEFNQGFTRALNSWATQSETASKAFAKMFGEIELQLIDFVAQWLLKKAEMWARGHVLQITGVAAQKTTQTAANVGIVTADAGVAFAGTMAYYAAVNPVAAPALAAAAAATTLAGGLSAQAFEHGGVVAGSAGSPVPIIAHAGERVLSASQTSNFHSLVNSQSSTRSSSRVVNVGGITNHLPATRSSPREISAAVQDGMRRGMIKGGF